MVQQLDAAASNRDTVNLDVATWAQTVLFALLAGHITARHNRALCEHSAAQHSTAQHSTSSAFVRCEPSVT